MLICHFSFQSVSSLVSLFASFWKCGTLLSTNQEREKKRGIKAQAGKERKRNNISPEMVARLRNPLKDWFPIKKKLFCLFLVFFNLREQGDQIYCVRSMPILSRNFFDFTDSVPINPKYDINTIKFWLLFNTFNKYWE